jgi:hypothetical protein
LPAPPTRGGRGEMTDKILILDREVNTLEIQDENDELCFSCLYNITHVKKDESDYGIETCCYDILNGPLFVGYIKNVKEIKEVW